MDYTDFTQVHPLRKRLSGVKRGILTFPRTLFGFFKSIGQAIVGVVYDIIRAAKEVIGAFWHGNWQTRVSFAVLGFGNAVRGQIGKGLLVFSGQLAYLSYLLFFGIRYLLKLNTLGTVTQEKIFDEAQGIYIYTSGDNSMKILLFGVLSIIITLVFAAIYFLNIRSAYRAQCLQAANEPLPTFREEWHSLFDKRYHVTLLSAPILLVTLFTVLPLLFMVLIAFTNFDKAHQPPGNLFTWVGFENFAAMFGGNDQLGYTFSRLLVWTLTWSLFATFTNYLFGMILALLINKKGIRFKKFWRTIFIITIAIPQFVSLMLMSQLLADEGAANILLKELGLIQNAIPFLTNGTFAKITVILVNMWVGIPYSMLITTGILLNIPADMYESAKIDGAGPAKAFFKITLPYMLFVTTPYLITQFVNNINNFNVIYLLTRGGPLTLEYFKAGKTDLLVTWLYKQTVEEQNYNLAGVIGVIVFVITAVFSLIVYNSSAASQKEEEFQ